jgi:hypothetical protein
MSRVKGEKSENFCEISFLYAFNAVPDLHSACNPPKKYPIGLDRAISEPSLRPFSTINVVGAI